VRFLSPQLLQFGCREVYSWGRVWFRVVLVGSGDPFCNWSLLVSGCCGVRQCGLGMLLVICGPGCIGRWHLDVRLHVDLMELLLDESKDEGQLMSVKGVIVSIYACPSPPLEGDGLFTCKLEMIDWRWWYCQFRVSTLSDRLS